MRVATFDSVWTDRAEALPVNDAESIWWEVWLPAGDNRPQVIADFRKVGELAGLLVRERALHFPERSDEGALSVPHRLESVKILQRPGDNDGQSYGAITAEAVARVEITAQDRRRVFAMAVSSTDGRDRGRPSSWSAEVDRLACDYDGQGETPRLFVLCAGNTQDPNAWGEYPASLSTNLVHDPGQAWNALTVGAYSELTTISEAFGQRYTPIAPAGGLSPYTTTSSTWQTGWPFKPDIVMEGGNAAIDETGFTSQMDSLSLLTTNFRPHDHLFSLSWATSASTAMAAGTSIPNTQGAAARRLESDLVYSKLTDNPALSDGKALFHADHGNLPAAASLSIASLGAARAAMRKQKGLTSSDYIDPQPRFLIVPVTLETAAEALLSSINKSLTTNTQSVEWIRGLTLVADPRLDASSETAWYLSADPRQVEGIVRAYLAGEQRPYLDNKEGWETDTMDYKVRLDIGVGVIDYRGLIKNVGA